MNDLSPHMVTANAARLSLGHAIKWLIEEDGYQPEDIKNLVSDVLSEFEDEDE